MNPFRFTSIYEKLINMAVKMIGMICRLVVQWYQFTAIYEDSIDMAVKQDGLLIKQGDNSNNLRLY